MLAFLPAVMVSVCPAQSVPGTIAVVYGDPAVITFDLPEGTLYQLDYGPWPGWVCFDRVLCRWALSPPAIYTARNHGDFTGDHALDAHDIPGFVSAFIDGPYDPRADFNDDGYVNIDDVVPFAEAVANGYPAEGVVLYVTPASISDELGDKPISLMTDPDEDEIFTVVETRPMTFIYFESGSNQSIGTAVDFVMQPAIAPLAFDENTTAVWEGYLELSTGNTETMKVKFDANQVRDRAPELGELLIGDGALDGPVPLLATLGTLSATAVGRTTFNFNGHIVKTQQFQYILDVDDMFRFRTLVFDPHDPEGYEPEYGQIAEEVRVVNIEDPENVPELDSMLWYQTALEVPVVENSDTQNSAPESMTVDLLSYRADGSLVDAMESLELIRVDDDGDSNFINYRSGVDRPLLFVDAAIDTFVFPGLRIMQTNDDGYMVVIRR